MNIAVIGIGYVGLPLLYSFSKKKLNVIGFDTNKSRIDELKNNFDKNIQYSKSDLLKNNINLT